MWLAEGGGCHTGDKMREGDSMGQRGLHALGSQGVQVAQSGAEEPCGIRRQTCLSSAIPKVSAFGPLWVSVLLSGVFTALLSRG